MSQASLNPTDVPPDRFLNWRDVLLLIAVATLLFGFNTISGCPLTMHESRLPETAREMMATGDWLVPRSGGRPWLERPPLPHWITIAVSAVLGQHVDSQWVVRIPPALMGLIGILAVAWIGAKTMGRRTGLVAGLLLATTWEYYRYATLAEDDIFLAAIVAAAMAMFVRMEFSDPLPWYSGGGLGWGWFRRKPRQDPLPNPPPEYRRRREFFLGSRPFPVIAFFLLLGLTGLVKGPLVGGTVILGPIGVYLILRWLADRRLDGFHRYFWLWGILIAAAIAFWWHLLIYKRFPEYWENLRYDFNDTTEYDEPWWYYFPTLLGVAMPWSPAALIALCTTARAAWRKQDRWLQFLWCWAIVPVILLSIPHRKHHHYLVPSLAPWALLAAIGARSILRHMFNGSEWTRRPLYGFYQFGQPGAVALLVLLLCHKIPGPAPVALGLIAIWLACVWAFYHGLFHFDAGWVLGAVVAGIIIGFDWGQTYWPNDTVDDRRFFQQANHVVPAAADLAVNAAVGPLDFFQIQFYLRPQAMLLHNLSYLRSDAITGNDIFIIGRAKDAAALGTLGTATDMLESAHTRRETSPAERFTLFHLIFTPGLHRYPPPLVSPMQAMQRKPGPDCGPPLPEPP